MSTLEERVTAERAAQGLPPTVQDRDVLDRIAAILFEAGRVEGGDGDAAA
jgi:hypothetical protein